MKIKRGTVLFSRGNKQSPGFSVCIVWASWAVRVDNC
jgi:hypothetical protein